jgi:hypothetical protein
VYFGRDYRRHRYVLEGGGRAHLRNIYKFLSNWTIVNISRFGVIMTPFTLASQVSIICIPARVSSNILFCIRLLLCLKLANYCVPVAVVQVTLIIRRGDAQWANCDKLVVSVGGFFNGSPFTATTVSIECRFEQGFGGIENKWR